MPCLEKCQVGAGVDGLGGIEAGSTLKSLDQRGPKKRERGFGFPLTIGVELF